MRNQETEIEAIVSREIVKEEREEDSDYIEREALEREESHVVGTK